MTSKSLDEVVTELRAISSEFTVNRIGAYDGDQLSKMLVRLAALKASLGEHVAIMMREADLAEATLKIKKEQVYAQQRAAGSTQGDADSAKRTQTEDLLKASVQRKYEAKLLAILREDTADLIEVLRSRRATLAEERAHADLGRSYGPGPA